MSLFASNPRLPNSELTPLQQPSVAVLTPKPEPFTGCVACCIFWNLGCWLFVGLALFAASSMGLFFSLAANPSQDFRIVDGDCKIGDTNMDRRTQEKEVERDSWEAHRCDNSPGTSSTGDYCTIYDCYADYTYEICVPEGHALTPQDVPSRDVTHRAVLCLHRQREERLRGGRSHLLVVHCLIAMPAEC